MTIPDTIPLSSVHLGERLSRTAGYNGIEELAESISQNGLIQPVIVRPMSESEWRELKSEVPLYQLHAGGRRYHALRELGVTTLHHATSSDPARPGFLFIDDDNDKLKALLIELAENHDRDDPDWRDRVRMIVKGYRMFELLAVKENRWHDALKRQFGAIAGVMYNDIAQAIHLIEVIDTKPEWFTEVNNLRSAYSVLLKHNADELAKVAALKSFKDIPKFIKSAPAFSGATDVKTLIDTSHSTPSIPISAMVHLGNGIEYMKRLPDNAFDHIITDPDFAIELEVLESHGSSAARGVYQDSAANSWQDLQEFIRASFRVTKYFCIFWYDLNYHERLMALARETGWLVQSWPLIWDKSDHRANGAPNHNFCKHFEYAMVLRKPGTTLVRAQLRTIYSCQSQPTAKLYGHPFSKPIELWNWLYSAVAVKGQTCYDPFAGKGSAPVAAVEFGLKPVAAEINEAHFSDLQLNLQAAFRKVIGPDTRFT